MSGGGINIRPDELDKGGDSLDAFASKLDANTSKVDEAHRGLSAHASSDRSGLGQVLVKFADKTGTAFSGIGKQLSRVVKGSSQRLKASSNRHRANEQEVTDSLNEIRSKGTDVKTHAGGNQSTTTSSAGGGSKTHEPPKVPGEGAGGGHPKGDSTEPSGAGGTAGGGGGDKGKGPATDAPDGPASKASPPLSGHQAPTSNGKYSQQFTNSPTLPEPSNYPKPLPDSNGYIPTDKSRGTKVTQLKEPEYKLTKDDNGLITHVNGEPVDKFMANLSKERAGRAADPSVKWQQDHPGEPVPKDIKNAGKERTCSALAIDRRTGLITQGVNGKSSHVIPGDRLHPLLQQNLQDMRAYQHPVMGKDGKLVEGTKLPNPYDGQAHYSVPAQHAEVKAVNELLWQRQAGHAGPLPASTLNEITYDPRWTGRIGDAGVGDPAAACANCNSILRGAHSNTGNCEYDPGDYRYVNPN